MSPPGSFGGWAGCAPGSRVRIRTFRRDASGEDAAEVVQTLLGFEADGARIRVSSRGHEHECVERPFLPLCPIAGDDPLLRLLEEKETGREKATVSGRAFDCVRIERRIREIPQCGNDDSGGTLIVESHWRADVPGGLLRIASRHIQGPDGPSPRVLDPVLTRAIAQLDARVRVGPREITCLVVVSEYRDHDARSVLEESSWLSAEVPCGWVRKVSVRRPFADGAPPSVRSESGIFEIEVKPGT